MSEDIAVCPVTGYEVSVGDGNVILRLSFLTHESQLLSHVNQTPALLLTPALAKELAEKILSRSHLAQDAGQSKPDQLQ